MTKSAEPQQDTAPRRGAGLLSGGLVVLIAGGYLAFRVLNPIIAVAVVIVAATVLGVAATAHDWDRHPRFEEREQVRAEKRKLRFAENQGARDKDRAKWEAHRARQREKEAREAAEGAASSD
jgi:uncharacterized membrane protein